MVVTKTIKINYSRYDSESGRFVSEDPIGFGAEENSVYPFVKMVFYFAASLFRELGDLLLEIYFLFTRYFF